MFSQKQNEKYHSKTQLDEKKPYLFMMFFLTSFFSISPLHVRRFLPYLIKKAVVEDFKAAQSIIAPAWTNVMEKLS